MFDKPTHFSNIFNTFSLTFTKKHVILVNVLISNNKYLVGSVAQLDRASAF